MSRIPVAARWCALIALLNTLAWSLVTPPFQVADETGHLVYVQYLAETGEVPDNPGAAVFSPEQGAMLDALRVNSVVGRPRDRALTTDILDAEVERLERERPSPVGGGGSVESSPQPPLYYAAQAAVYQASPWKGLLERVWLMRVFSCLLAAATTLFTFLFLRELVRTPWMWTLGALAVAFQPVFAFTSSGLTPDSLLFAASTATLFGLARAFRRGLTMRLGLGIGAALAVGTLAKLNFVALLPGALLGLALLAAHAPADGRRRALIGAGAAVGVLAAAVVVYVGLNTLIWDRPALGGGVENAANVAAGTQAADQAPTTKAEQVSYVWQLYLPRLPFMNDQFANHFPLWQTWFKGFIGLFGWLDTPFTEWVYRLALALVAPLLALLAFAFVRGRSGLRRRLPEIACYVAIAGGLMVSIGILGLRYLDDTGNRFEQARYLLPLLPFYGAALALAVRASGERFARPLATAVLVVMIAHNVFSQLLVISRFYG